MSDITEKILERLKRLEREVERLRVKERPAGGSGVTDHGALTGLEDNDHPQYLLTTAKAADSDKLDNIDSTGFVQTSGNQTVGGIKTFTSIPALPATNPTTANQAVRKGFANATYLGISAKAADSDKLDGLDSTAFATAGHDHNGTYIPLTNFASSNATVTGWSGTPTKIITYVVIGKLLLMSIFVTGTSNATTASVTIPSGLTSASQGVPQILPVRVVDNGVVMQAPGMAVLENNGTVIQIYLDYSGSGFTASGTKEVTGNFAWIIN